MFDIPCRKDPYHSSRQKCHHGVDGQTLFFGAGCKPSQHRPDAFAVVPADSQNCTRLNCHDEFIGPRCFGKSHQIRSNNEMTGRADRKKFGKTLDNAENSSLQKIKPIHDVKSCYQTKVLIIRENTAANAAAIQADTIHSLF